MLDRNVGLTRPDPERATDAPSARKTRIQRECTIDERRHAPDVFAQIGRRHGNIHQYARIVTGHFQGPAREIEAFTPVQIRIFTATVAHQHSTTNCSERECGSVMRIVHNRLFEEAERVGGLLIRRPH